MGLRAASGKEAARAGSASHARAEEASHLHGRSANGGGQLHWFSRCIDSVGRERENVRIGAHATGERRPTKPPNGRVEPPVPMASNAQ